MWTRILDTKHANFPAADTARKKWYNDNPNAVRNGSHKVRIKHRPNNTYDLIVWRNANA